MSESSGPLRILLFGDSHLGFDLPVRPRVDRRRRGDDFLANHQRALAPARAGKVDLVVHGGDVFHRPRVPPSLAFQALEPLREVAEQGIPVFVVPGNHERSRIPHHRFAAHPLLHIFREPGTREIQLRGLRVAVSGFPYERSGVRHQFRRILAATGWRGRDADVRILCMHHCVEGATVGPGNFTFRTARDVIRCADLPAGCAGVLSGHIHRHQVLTRDLSGAELPVPVIYPGSLERTAFAEVGEKKGFMILEVTPGNGGGQILRSTFIPLPHRSMEIRHLHPGNDNVTAWTSEGLRDALGKTISGLPPDAVLRIQLHGFLPPALRPLVGAKSLRRLAPAEMNLEVRCPQETRGSSWGRRRKRMGTADAASPTPGSPSTSAQMGLNLS